MLAGKADQLLALYKPEGVLSHPNSPSDSTRSLLRLPYDEGAECYRGKEGVLGDLHLLHRLDGPTSGVIVLSADPEMSALVREAFRKNEVRKTYLAILKGGPLKKREIWEDALITSREGRTAVRSRRSCRGEKSVTEILLKKRLTGTPSVMVVEMRPRTGRTHQLRVQAAARKMPVLGDKTYGDFTFNRDLARRTGDTRLMLHAWRIEVPLGKGNYFRATSPVPKAFLDWEPSLR